MEIQELICIGCPMGCPLQAEMEDGVVLSISGNTCKRGEVYARKELTSPTRIVTTTVRVEGGTQPVVSVKTKEDIPKNSIFRCMEELKRITAAAPVKIGDVVLENAAETGVDVVATKNVDEQDVFL